MVISALHAKKKKYFQSLAKKYFENALLRNEICKGADMDDVILLCDILDPA